MAEQAIPFAPDQQSGQEQLAGGSPTAMNVIIDRRGAVRRRPGVAAIPGFSDDIIDERGINGLRGVNNGDVYATSPGSAASTIYRVVSGGGINIGRVEGTQRPTWAETQTLLITAAGYRIVKILLGVDDSEILGGNPPLATHVAANSSRLLANDLNNSALVQYSGFASGNSTEGFEEWGGVGNSGFFSAEARPDDIVAIDENTNEIFVFGATNTQLFSPDSVSAYVPVSTREYGCSAPYSVIKIDQAFAWFDHLRRFVVSDGRSYEVISDAIAQTLDDIDDIQDCFGYRVHEGPVDALVWTFPTDGRTFAYQIGGGWSQWMGRSESGWDRFMVNAQYLVKTANLTQAPLPSVGPSQGNNLVGTTEGRVGILKNQAQTDFGRRIVAEVTTGFIHRGTDARKQCKSVRLVLQRGRSSGNEPLGRLSWRNDEGEWEGGIEIGFGEGGDYDPIVHLRSLGVYRRRQWRFEFSDAEELVLASATEEYDVLGS